jgi:glycosyltransferase involved in cell wall biosynthesis
MIGPEISISVLMITYNQASYIAKAIESVVAQRLDTSFELIIGEDCSTDRTREIVQLFRDQHPDIIRVITSPKNVGMNENLRRVALAARGEYVAFCEGDDLWHNPDKLSLQLSLARTSPSIGMVYSDYDRAIRMMGRWRILSNEIGRSGETPAHGDAFEELLDRIQVHLSTMLCRRSLVTAYFESNLYEPSLRLGDVPLLLYCAAHGEVAYLPESTSIYRAAPGSATNGGSRHRLGIFEDHVAVVRRFEERFGSDPDRRRARAAKLNALIATGAYAACDRRAYAALADGGTKARLRNALMRAPVLHRLYMQWVAQRQKFEFWSVSEDARQRLN